MNYSLQKMKMDIMHLLGSLIKITHTAYKLSVALIH